MLRTTAGTRITAGVRTTAGTRTATGARIKVTNSSFLTNISAYLKLDEGLGVSVIDSSGNGNTGTLTNSPTWATGKIGNALTFVSASSQFVTIPDSSSLQVTSSFTVAAWVKLTSAPSNIMFALGKDDATLGRQFAFGVYSDGGIYLQAAGAAPNAPGSTKLTSSTWTYILATYNWTGSVGNISYYFNGSLDNQTTTTGNVASTTAPLYIGGRSFSGSQNYFDGSIDEAVLWGRVLSDSEISQLYNNGAGLQFV